MGQLLPITPPAGVVANGTQYSVKGRWVDSDLVRFQEGHLEPIGGWQLLSGTALTGGAVRQMFAYRDNGFDPILAVATDDKVHTLYLSNFDEITPAGFVGASGSGNLAYGFGAGPYGEESFGDARTVSGLKKKAINITFDSFGEDLLFCSSGDGKIYRWQPNSGSAPDAAGAVLTNAPVANTAVAVTNERHVLALGAGGDPRKVQFSDQEAPTTWTPTATNLAGSIILQTQGSLMAGVRYKTDMLLFTDEDVHRMYYVGAPLAYGVQKVGSACGPLSPRCIVPTGNFIAWLSENGPVVYDGFVRQLPCEVHDFIYDNLNSNAHELVCGGSNSVNSEIWWFFPTTEDDRNSKYVIYNYQEKVWSVGELERGAWIDRGAFDVPLAGDKDGFLYEHERGTLSAASGIGTRKPFCKTGPIEVGTGDRVAYVNRIIPDEESNSVGCVSFAFKGRQTPLGTEYDLGTFNIDADGYTDCRFSARQVQMTVEGVTDRSWKLGQVRLEGALRGRR